VEERRESVVSLRNLRSQESVVLVCNITVRNGVAVSTHTMQIGQQRKGFDV
jgi:hypothetical protein